LSEFCLSPYYNYPPTRKLVDVFSRGVQNILKAIETGSNQKLILVTGIGAGDSKGHGGFFYDRLLNPLLLATNYADKDRAESIVKASNVKWLTKVLNFAGL
jgi:NAD(P)H-binding